MNKSVNILTIIVLQFILKINCQRNNVCPTFEDYYTIKNNSRCWYDCTVNSSVIEIIRRNGYPVETHKVMTPDGYILTVFRIPNYYTGYYGPKKGPIFLQHGWLNSAAIFVSRGKDSLAFTLADAGYDVWLGNFRGSQYSEEHANLTVSDQQYWDYSADEIGLFDIPSQLELVAQRTNQRGNIIYIGHSLGTTAALIYGSQYPQLSKETVKLFVMLAPAANLSHMKSLLFRVFGRLFGLILSLLPVIFNQLPAGTSFKVTKQIADFSLNNFGRFNYGLGNYQKYGSIISPKFDVAKVEVPVFIMYAVNDWACTKEDSLILYNKLSPKVRYGIHEISERNFNHLDFCFGNNIKTLVNEPILRHLMLRN